MFDIEDAENIHSLKKKYYYNQEIYDKLCALSYMISKGVMPEEIAAFYNRDIKVMERNIIGLA